MFRKLLHPVGFFTALAAVGILSCYPLSFIAPPHAGWENGPVENAQVVILLIGLVCALRYVARATDIIEQRFWLMVVPFWLIFVGRELSWGAVFTKPLHVDEEGPAFSSGYLWYKPVVYPVLGLLLAFSAYLMLRHRLWRVLWTLMRERRFPWLQLALSVVAILVSTNAEGHGWFVFDLTRVQLQVLEELVETAAYVSLFAAQLAIRYGSGHAAR